MSRPLTYQDRDTISEKLLEKLKEIGHPLDAIDADEFLDYFDEIIEPFTTGGYTIHN